jgi:hypothetical protein
MGGVASPLLDFDFLLDAEPGNKNQRWLQRSMAFATSNFVEPDPKENEYTKYAKDPIGFITEVLKRYLTDDQEKLCISVLSKQKTNCQAAHGVGKSFLAADLVIWWTYAVEGIAITSAPTKRQVQEILWGNIRLTFGDVKLDLPDAEESGLTFFRRTESARSYGFTAASHDANGFQGIHNEKLLVILDEACGISQVTWDGAEACITGSKNRFLSLGNPISSGNPFSKSCAKNNIRIPVWTHPNVNWAYELHEDGIHRLKDDVRSKVIDIDGLVKPQELWPDDLKKDKIPGAVSISWIEDTARPRGETSAWWQSRVEGLFPTDSAQSIIPRSWFLAARARYDSNPEYWQSVADQFPRRSGLDVGDGGDPHALATWQGVVLTAVKQQNTIGDREDVTRAAVLGKTVLTEETDTLNVDRTGVGAGALAILCEQQFRAYGIHFGDGAVGTDGLKLSNENEDETDPRYLNLKAQLFWELRESFRTGEAIVAPLGEYEETLIEELCAIYWDETSVGKIRIEDKVKKTKPRLGRSPNCADAVAMAYKQMSMDYRSAHALRPERSTLPPRQRSRGIY